MTVKELSRRHILCGAIAVPTFPVGHSTPATRAAGERVFDRPFAGSRTITNFALGLMCVEDQLPGALVRAIDAEAARIDVLRCSREQECEQARFFAWLAARVVAARACRRAGYDALAAGLEDEREWSAGGAAALAQQTIGREHRDLLMLGRVQVAYGASAHASTSGFYASHEDIETVVQTGEYCARALAEPFCRDNPESAETAWSLKLATAAINTATAVAAGPNLLEAQAGLRARL